MHLPINKCFNMHKKDNIFLRWHLYVHIPCIAYLMRWKQSYKAWKKGAFSTISNIEK